MTVIGTYGDDWTTIDSMNATTGWTTENNTNNPQLHDAADPMTVATGDTYTPIEGSGANQYLEIRGGGTVANTWQAIYKVLTGTVDITAEILAFAFFYSKGKGDDYLAAGTNSLQLVVSDQDRGAVSNITQYAIFKLGGNDDLLTGWQTFKVSGDEDDAFFVSGTPPDFTAIKTIWFRFNLANPNQTTSQSDQEQPFGFDWIRRGTGFSVTGGKNVESQASATRTFSFNDNSPSADTITCSSGSFITDGWVAGDKVRVIGSKDNDEAYTIAAGGVAATTLTLVSGDALNDETGNESAILVGYITPEDLFDWAGPLNDLRDTGTEPYHFMVEYDGFLLKTYCTFQIGNGTTPTVFKMKNGIIRIESSSDDVGLSFSAVNATIILGTKFSGPGYELGGESVSIVVPDHPVAATRNVSFIVYNTGSSVGIYGGIMQGMRNVIIGEAAANPTVELIDLTIAFCGTTQFLSTNLYTTNCKIIKSVDNTALDIYDEPASVVGLGVLENAYLGIYFDSAISFDNFENLLIAGHTIATYFNAEGVYNMDGWQFQGNTVDIQNPNNALVYDSYTEANYDTLYLLYNGYTSGEIFAQTFTTGPAESGPLARMRFHLSRFGSPTGNVVARLYATSGGVPTGAPLIESFPRDVTEFVQHPAVPQNEDFIFTFRYDFSPSTTYAVALHFEGGDASNHVRVGFDASAPTHPGTAYYFDTAAWQVLPTGADMVFYVTAEGVVEINALGNANPSTFLATGPIEPSTVVVNKSVPIAVTVLDDADNSPLPDARAALNLSSDKSSVMFDQADAQGIISTTYNYKGDVNIEGWAREHNLVGDDYQPKDIAGTITENGFAITVRLQKVI